MKCAELPRRRHCLASRRGWDIEIMEGGGHTKERLNGRRATIPPQTPGLKAGMLRGILKQLELTEDDLGV